MVNNSYICGAETFHYCVTNTDLGGVPDLHIVVQYGCFCKNNKGASLSLYILTN